MKKLSGRKGYIFQQDGATSHTATMVIEYLEKKVPELFPPDIWPPSSPDLNPEDYGLWSILKKDVYSVKIYSMDQLKQGILKCLDEIPQETVDRTIDGFCKQVKKMIEVGGRRFEHLLK